MLTELGCDVYQEVPIPKDSGIADIVALRGPELWIVETKSSWSLDLLEQCVARRRHAHRVFAAVPWSRVLTDRARLFSHVGVGTIAVPTSTQHSPHIASWPPRLVSPRTSTRRGRNFPAALRARLSEGHKTHAKAGSNSGGRYTPFRQTCEGLLALVRREPGVTLTDAIARISHHYSSMHSARGAMAKWIEAGSVPGVRGQVGSDRKLRLYPVPV